MNFFYKNRFVFWLMLVLVVINLSALLTFIFYLPYRAENVSSNHQEVNPASGFQHELSLNPDQSEAVEKINSAYRSSSQPIVDQLRNKRLELLEELSSRNPDTSVLNVLTRDLSLLQTNLQRENIRQYLALKKICTPDQALKLSQLYKKLYGCEQSGFGKGKGQGRGQGKGMQHRYGRGNNDSSRSN